jgi:alcohol dehydrogenase class IV
MIDAAVAEHRDRDVSVVVAVGGGSVVDAGKAISAMLPSGRPVADFLEGVGREQHPGDKVPLIAVPTSSGTGSEATKNAVISEVGENGFKKSLRHDNFVPDLAIVDPKLAVSCPPSVTAACGMDALCQLLESYASTQASPMTDSLAHDGIRRVVRSLESACGDGAEDIEVRTDLAYGAFISGITLANAGLGVVHGIAGPLGGLFPIPHGVACGTLLGPAMGVTLERLRQDEIRYAEVLEKLATAGALFGRSSPDDVTDSCNALVEGIRELTEALALPRLADFGIRFGDVRRIAASSGNKNHPIALDEDDRYRIIRESV